MLKKLFLAVAFVGYFTNQAIIIETPDLLETPTGVTGDFAVSSTPPKIAFTPITGLPQPDSKTLWSNWGNGILASNKKYYTAIGDHRGIGGNSYVYEYIPSTQTLNKIVDVAQVIGQKATDYGHGKIHAPMHEYNGRIWFTTYYGTTDALTKGFKGSLLFNYNLTTKVLTKLGTPAPFEGLPHSCIDRSRGLLYFYAVPKGDLVVYKISTRTVKFKGGSQFTATHRAFMQARDGKVYFSDRNGRLSFYDPLKNSIIQTGLILPGPENTLRAATRATSDGRIYGMTSGGTLFVFTPGNSTITNLGPNFLSGDYTAVMVLSPNQRYIYFAPGSHGSAAKVGTPVVQYNIAGGTRKVIAFLRDPVIQAASYYIAGDYNMHIDSNGAVLYCTFNGAPYTPNTTQQTFGLPSVVSIAIPSIERQ